MNDAIQKLLVLINANHGINDKARLARIVFDAFGLTKEEFSINTEEARQFLQRLIAL